MDIKNIKLLPATNAVGHVYADKTGNAYLGYVMSGAGCAGESPTPPTPPEPTEWQLSNVNIWADMDDGSVYFGFSGDTNKDLTGYNVYVTGTAGGGERTNFSIKLKYEDGELMLDREYADNVFGTEIGSPWNENEELFTYTATAVPVGEGDTLECSGTWEFVTTLEPRNIVVSPSQSSPAGYTMSFNCDWNLTNARSVYSDGFDGNGNFAFETYFKADSEDSYKGVQDDELSDDMVYEAEYVTNGGTCWIALLVKDADETEYEVGTKNCAWTYVGE